MVETPAKLSRAGHRLDSYSVIQQVWTELHVSRTGVVRPDDLELVGRQKKVKMEGLGLGHKQPAHFKRNYAKRGYLKRNN